MKFERIKSVIESVLFAAGRVVKASELASILEMTPDEVEDVIQNCRVDYSDNSRGIEIIKVEDGYQLSTKKMNYEYIVQLLDTRAKPTLSNAALETLAIISYNPNISRAEIDAIRGLNSEGSVYRLLEFDLIEVAGRLDLPGKPVIYRTTENFLKMFGLSSLDELPTLPRYKLDENEQIVIEDLDNI